MTVFFKKAKKGNFLVHYGTPRHSGRYPWGSGENPYQGAKSFLASIEEMKRKGMSEVDIAKANNMSTKELREIRSIARTEVRQADIAEAIRLKQKGYSNVAIGERMGKNESTIRSLLKDSTKKNAEITKSTAELLKENVNEKGYIDVGLGVEKQLGISRTRLQTSLQRLKEEGYQIHYIPVEQMGTGKTTYVMVLASPDSKYSDVYNNKDKIRLITDKSEDGGLTYQKIEPPVSVDSDRIYVRYAEEGGIDRDGVIQLRRGVDDISLGNAKYAQVRIAVDNSHYLKGMAMYSDDIPDGYDIVFNTNKKKSEYGKNKLSAMKEMESDPENPFGASIKWMDEDLILAQRHYIDKDGNRQLSALNIVNEEGDWATWTKSLSSQVLSKQPVNLAKKQLGLAYDIKKEEFDEIMSLTNPVIKEKLLYSFADDCDAAAVHLKAAALPRQSSHVILPFPDIKENEIFATNYRDGEKVVLIRHPHGGNFEIPELTVNNKYKSARKVLGNDSIDAVGINPKVASILSGADFDGDTVLVIPNNSGQIKRSSPLKNLKNFDPKESYKGYPGMKVMTEKQKGIEMGNVSNLITDMTIKGADTNEICRAVRHSMVVIDAVKHKLNWKQSEVDNGIAQLKKKYQGKEDAGASTLISKASSEQRVPDRKKSYKPDPETGKYTYTETGKTYYKPIKDKKTGEIKGYKEVKKTTKSTKMAEVDDAYQLSSGTMIESVYADHANKLKSLANSSRKAAVNIKYNKYNPSAKETYAPEVESLKAKLSLAISNKPHERQAQILANTIVDAKKKDNPDMSADKISKVKGQAITQARTKVGAKKETITITDREWEAIQAGAVSTNVLKQIADNSDMDRLKTLATPRTKTGMTSGKIAQARSMIDNGYTMSEVADHLGVSVTTLTNAIK